MPKEKDMIENVPSEFMGAVQEINTFSRVNGVSSMGIILGKDLYELFSNKGHTHLMGRPVYKTNLPGKVQVF